MIFNILLGVKIGKSIKVQMVFTLGILRFQPNDYGVFHSEFGIRKVVRSLDLSTNKGNIHPVTWSQRVNIRFKIFARIVFLNREE